MKIQVSLLWKLTLAFLLVAMTAAALVALLIRLTSEERLNSLILDQQRSILQTALAEFYQSRGSWEGVEGYWVEIIRQLRPAGEPQRVGGRSGERVWSVPFGLADVDGTVILPAFPDYPLGVDVPANALRYGTPVEVDGVQVGTILTVKGAPRLSQEETLFLRRTNIALVYATLGALLVALVIGLLLASTLIRPLRALTQAAQKIAQGQLEQQVDVRSGDEIGQLADSFNRMSAEVARVNQQRKQMTADIAHDLRTPLTVIGGYVESMRDGVLKPTPERLALIYTEIERLQHLVGDLRMLSQADAGELPLHPQAIAPRTLLEHAAAPFQHHAALQQVVVQLQAAKGLPEVWADEARMMQVFGNLLSNALRYTPPGGSITLAAEQDAGRVCLSVRDTGAGIPEEDLPFIFDRFHRADKSRHNEGSESGLGLAIVKALVEAQGGTVQAHSMLGQGTTVTIALPANHRAA